MSAQVAADLRAAADVLERDGWVREAYIDERGCCCAVGALMKAVDPSASPGSDVQSLATVNLGRAQRAAKALIAVVAPDSTSWIWEAPITRWNDDVAKNAAEVIAALRAAADRAEAQS